MTLSSSLHPVLTGHYYSRSMSRFSTPCKLPGCEVSSHNSIPRRSQPESYKQRALAVRCNKTRILATNSRFDQYHCKTFGTDLKIKKFNYFSQTCQPWVVIWTSVDVFSKQIKNIRKDKKIIWTEKNIFCLQVFWRGGAGTAGITPSLPWTGWDSSALTPDDEALGATGSKKILYFC